MTEGHSDIQTAAADVYGNREVKWCSLLCPLAVMHPNWHLQEQPRRDGFSACRLVIQMHCVTYTQLQQCFWQSWSSNDHCMHHSACTLHSSCQQACTLSAVAILLNGFCPRIVFGISNAACNNGSQSCVSLSSESALLCGRWPTSPQATTVATLSNTSMLGQGRAGQGRAGQGRARAADNCAFNTAAAMFLAVHSLHASAQHF